MPELPEVEIVKQSLNRKIKGKIIQKVSVKNRNLRFKLSNNFEKKIINKKIVQINRFSKYIILKFDDSSGFIIHLGMSGTIHLVNNLKKNNITNSSFYHSPNLPKKHNHIEIKFKKTKLIYNDPRRFGYFKILNNKQELDNYFTRIGPEALDKGFNFIYLKNKIKNKKKNIKNFLLDQKIVSGLGNIYVNEILHKSGILPMKSVSKLNSTDLTRIIKHSRITLKNAIKFGGSSIKDFKGVSGGGGSFQTKFNVYDRENQKCNRRKCNGIIQKRYISNRSTFICNFCQT